MAKRKGPLQVAVDDYLETGEPTKKALSWWDRVVNRAQEIGELIELADVAQQGIGRSFTALTIVFAYIYIPTGIDVFKVPLEMQAKVVETVDVKDKISDFYKTAFDEGPWEDIIDIVGTMTSEPILALFEELTPEDVRNPRAFVRRLHGTMVGLALAPGIVSSVMEALSMGQIDTPVEVVKSIYWNFGLGFLGWQSIAPMMNAGMLSVLERHYAEKFRPKRFSASELRDLYALGEISQERFEQEARELGWNEGDMQLWKKLAFRQLSESDINDLLLAGRIDQNEWGIRMRAKGYDPADYNHLFWLATKEDVDEAITVTLGTAKKALREGLMSEGEFKETLTDLNKSEREIELLIAIERETAEHELRALTVSQIRNAWEENVLSDNEARHWLSVNRFGDAEITLIMRTWKAEIEPVFRRLNKGTILGAYITAVINRELAAAKLESIGFAPADARLELDLAEARSPEVFGAPAPKPPRYLAPGALSELLEAGIITPLLAKTKLLEQNYTDDDANLLVQAMIVRAEAEPRPLSDFLIQRAYASLVLSRELALGHLLELEFDEGDANLILDTVEAENPSVFAPETVQAVRLPTVGALVESLRIGLIDDMYFYARMYELGYERESADMYLALALRTERKRVKTLSKAEIKRLYDMEIFDRAVAMIRMMGLGYTDEDANLILRTVKSGIEFTDTWRNMLLGMISPENAIEQLFSMGFTEDEITDALEALPVGE